MEPEQIIVGGSNEAEIKSSFFRNLFSKIKNIWLALPKKFRIAASVLLILTLILTVFALLSNKFNPLDRLRKISQKDILEQYNEGWEKLQIPQREPAFFTLKPQTENKYGILPQETFTLTSREPVDEKFVIESLTS